MNWSFKIGRIGATELKVHGTFFLLLLWISVIAWVTGGPAAAAINLLFFLALFACVLLHELGHAAMASRYGVTTPDITLLPIGGLARLDHIPEDPKQEILIALAGPAVNLVIWIALGLIAGGVDPLGDLQSIEDFANNFWGRLAAVNFILFAFNLIPAFPMDGGRVFRASLSFFMDRVTATRVAAHAGQVMAFFFGFLGLAVGAPLLVFIAIFIYFAAGAESSDAAMRDRAHGATAKDAMITHFETLRPHDTLQTAAHAILRTTQSEFPVLDTNSQFLGFLSRDSVLSTPDAAHSATSVSSMLTRDAPTFEMDARMDDVLDAFTGRNVPAVAVTDRKGTFLGYINRENIGEWFILSRQ